MVISSVAFFFTTYLQTIYLPSRYLFSYLSTYIWDLFLTKLVTKVKPNLNSVEVHPQLSNNGHPVDGALVGAAGSLLPNIPSWPLYLIFWFFMLACAWYGILLKTPFIQAWSWYRIEDSILACIRASPLVLSMWLQAVPVLLVGLPKIKIKS